MEVEPMPLGDEYQAQIPNLITETEPSNSLFAY